MISKKIQQLFSFADTIVDDLQLSPLDETDDYEETKDFSPWSDQHQQIVDAVKEKFPDLNVDDIIELLEPSVHHPVSQPIADRPEYKTVADRTYEFMKMAASKKEVQRALNLLQFGRSPDDAVKKMMEKGSEEDDAIAAVLTAIDALKPAEPLEGPPTEKGLPSFEDEEPESEPDYGMFETVEKTPKPEGEWGEGTLRDILLAGEKVGLKKDADSIVNRLLKKLGE